MASIFDRSAGREYEEEARSLVADCIAGREWPRDAVGNLVERDRPELFSIVAEGLSDRFERRLCDVYADIFSEVIARALPRFRARELRERYERVRQPRRAESDPPVVFVLSRVTLGADIAITSVLLDAAKRRFSKARIVLVGDRKSAELFAADPRLEVLLAPYSKAKTLRERLAVCPELPDGIVIDPDSRLTQLGLLPVCPEENYYFFESRAYGGDGDEPLGTLARRWAIETLGVEDARSYIRPAMDGERAAITASLGVGGNPAKGMPPRFERVLMEALAARGPSLLVDQGAGGEEAERVERAIDGLDKLSAVRTHRGPFAAFSASIARSELFVGYDSAGQHAAAAHGVPRVTVFAGFPNERFLARWRPAGAGRYEVVRADEGDTLARTLSAVDRIYS